VISASRYAERLERARAAAAENGVAALLLGPGADLRYLTGYAAVLLERLTMLVLPADGQATLIAPALEAMAATESPAGAAGLVEIVGWNETDDPHRLAAELVERSSGSGRLLVDDRLWAMHVLALQRGLPARAFGLATEVLADLRMVKDAEEIDLLRQAAHAADRVIDQVAAGRLVGRTEAEVSREIGRRLTDEGHDTTEFAIVAAGPNAASPHHAAGDRRIGPGEAVVLDIGGLLGGYCSDTTRTIWVGGGDGGGEPEPEFVAVYDLVQRAQAEATEAVRPGVSCEEIDSVARRVIVAGGYGERFIHRVGHGIGLEAHEEPYLVAGSRRTLAEGVTFSIEPGIYLPGRFGVRIEDIVACSARGADVLNVSSRDLRVVAG
jgi:Xaa-Pro aminopeptidase